MELLSGYKTYILATIGALISGLGFAGVIDPETVTTLLGLLGFGTAATLRAGVAKSQKTRRLP